MTNRFNFNKLFTVDLTVNVDSFISYLFTDISIWYQYSNTNPDLNFKNIFICSDGGITIAPITLSFSLKTPLQSCYKTILNSLKDWPNWIKFDSTKDFWGILDECSTSDPKDITLKWNFLKESYTLPGLGWGNDKWGDPQIDWDGTKIKTSPGLQGQFNFDYCYHVLGNRNNYDLNNGGPADDTWCMASSIQWSKAFYPPSPYPAVPGVCYVSDSSKIYQKSMGDATTLAC